MSIGPENGGRSRSHGVPDEPSHQIAQVPQRCQGLVRHFAQGAAPHASHPLPGKRMEPVMDGDLPPRRYWDCVAIPPCLAPAGLPQCHLPRDWHARYALRPIVLGTFCESPRFHGPCYRAANWIHHRPAPRTRQARHPPPIRPAGKEHLRQTALPRLASDSQSLAREPSHTARSNAYGARASRSRAGPAAEIPGVGRSGAHAFLAELGPEPAKVFPDSASLAALAGVCPGNNESAGKQRSGRVGTGNAALWAALTECALGVARTRDSQVHGYHDNMKARIGHKRATLATARKGRLLEQSRTGCIQQRRSSHPPSSGPRPQIGAALGRHQPEARTSHCRRKQSAPQWQEDCVRASECFMANAESAYLRSNTV